MVLKTSLITLDSIYSNYNNNGTNAYDTKYLIPNTIRNVKKIKLKSLEMVTTFNTFRASNGSNTLSVIINGITYIITIPELSYTTSTALLTAINSAYVALSAPVTCVFSFDTTYINRVRVTLGSVQTFTIINGVLSNMILGFTKSQTSSGAVTFLANVPYCYSVDTYLMMYFKIALNADSDQIYYYVENSMYSQEIEITSDHFQLTDLHIQFYDRLNCLVNCYTDYGCTLEITYDEF